MITIADVLSKIRDNLDWRSLNGETLAHVCLTYEEALYLHGWALRLIRAKDELEHKHDELFNTNGQLAIDLSTLQRQRDDLLSTLDMLIDNVETGSYESTGQAIGAARAIVTEIRDKKNEP